jgi:hypothetical protein
MIQRRNRHPETWAGARPIGAALLVLALAASAPGEVFFLKNGDRVTGRLATEGKRSLTVRTPYGRLVIPRAHVLRYVRDDGTEVNPNPTPTPVPTPTPEPACTLVLEIEGSVFWYAWAPRPGEEIDPTLRFRLRLDGAPLALLTDGVTDPGAVGAPLVNRFSFSDVSMDPAAGVVVAAPELASGRVRLELRLPVDTAGTHRLDVAYQINDGTIAAPAFRDLVFADVELVLQPARAARVILLQDRGRMEYSGLFRKQLKHVDTFRIEAQVEAER